MSGILATAPPARIGYDPLRDSRHKHARSARECADWQAWLELEGKASRTLDDYERTAAVLLRMFPDLPLDKITDAELVHVLRTFPPKSRRIRRAHLSSWFTWAYRTGRIDRNPLDLVPRQKRHQRRLVETFTDAERALLEGLPAPDGPLLAIMFGAGLRKGECRRLQAKHVDLERGRIIVRAGKGGKDRLVPIRALAQTLAGWFLVDGIELEQHLWYTRPGGGQISRVRPIGEGSFHRWWERCLERAGVRYRNPHVTRHTFAVNWPRSGGRLETLSLALGHESIKTTFDEYGGLTADDVALDLELVEG